VEVSEGLGASFVVFDEPSEPGRPGEGSLDHPSSWQQDEAALSLRQLRASFSSTASVIQVLREMLPGRTARVASIASNVSGGSRRLIRSKERIAAVFESANMAPHWRLLSLTSIDVSILFPPPRDDKAFLPKRAGRCDGALTSTRP
jgi:hypothetical protein